MTTYRQVGDFGQRCSVFGFVLSDSLVSSLGFLKINMFVYILFSLLWLFGVGGRLIVWLSLAQYTLVSSLYVENIYFCEDHTIHILNFSLIMNALWFQFSITTNNPKYQFLRSPDRLPGWYFVAHLYYIALYYSFAGFSKLYESGIAWANGTSLQIWAFSFANRNFLLTDWILNSKELAHFLQIGVLWLECSAFLILFSKKYRYLWCSAILVFHLCIELMFNYRFYYHFAFLVLFASPLTDYLLTSKRTASFKN